MKKQIPINHLIFEKIKFRYDLIDPTRVYERGLNTRTVMDSYYPHYIAMNIIHAGNPRHLAHFNGKHGYCISERVSKDMSVKKLHISELTSMLGYTKTDISKILQRAKNKEINIALVGVGGTGSNFLHWLYEMCEWTGKIGIFNKITVFDNDTYDVPNLLRIPFIPEFNGQEEIPYKVNCIPKKFKEVANDFKAYASLMKNDNLKPSQLGVPSNTIIYGAPGIETRRWLSANKTYTFFAATHRDSEYSIVCNPAVDNDLMMETYGKINLAKFFMNHLSMTLDFLKYIGNHDRDYNVQVQNEDIVKCDFNDVYADKIREGFKAGAKKFFFIDSSHHANRTDIELPGGN